MYVHVCTCMSMNINTVLSKSVDNQTTKNLIQSLQGKQKKIQKYYFSYICPGSNKNRRSDTDLCRNQKGKKFMFLGEKVFILKSL